MSSNTQENSYIHNNIELQNNEEIMNQINIENKNIYEETYSQNPTVQYISNPNIQQTLCTRKNRGVFSYAGR